MAEVWVSLLVGGTLLLIGYGASLIFDKFRIPDFIVLIFLGVLLAQIPVEPFGPGLVPSLTPILPVFTALTIAFIMFEGGLSLNLKGSGRGMPGVLAHVAVSVFITVVLIWLIATRLLGFDGVTALVLAGAFCGPSAAVILSFATRLKLGKAAERAVVLDAVVTNVIAVILVFFAIRSASAEPATFLHQYALEIALATIVAIAAGIPWRMAIKRSPSRKFMYIATVAWALVIYGIADGLINGNGAVAAFVFGLVLAYRKPEDAPDPEGKGSLQEFQSEITFGMRTFFFIYLGLVVTVDSVTPVALIGALLLTLVFVVSRVPSSIALGRLSGFSKRETRVLIASMARGMTDVVLILIAIESGVVPASSVPLLVGLVTVTILVAVAVCAGLVVWAERSPMEEQARENPPIPPDADVPLQFDRPA
jgi:cell volume regulation protein A